MYINENIQIIGEKVILVPYEAKHVETYHSWMKDPILQQLTGSEPLTLEEEYEMQKQWREDDNKLTFLIMDRQKYEETNDEIVSIIGDINLFFSVHEDIPPNKVHVAELSIMIANEAQRNKGFGRESILLILKYALSITKIDVLEVKINEHNLVSLHLFKKINFKERSKSAVFKEITLECQVSPDWIKWLDIQTHSKIQHYHK